MALPGLQRPQRKRRWKRPDPNITVPLVLHLRKPLGVRRTPMKRARVSNVADTLILQRDPVVKRPVQLLHMEEKPNVWEPSPMQATLQVDVRACRLCGFRLLGASHASTHICGPQRKAVHHHPEQLPSGPALMSNATAAKGTLQQAQTRPAPREENEYGCKSCGGRFAGASEIYRHACTVRQMHPESRCEQQVAVEPSHEAASNATGADTKARMHETQGADQGEQGVGGAARAKSGKKPGSKIFKCGTCVAHFTSKASRILHEQAVHQKLKPYLCDVPGCGKSFGQRSVANRHRLVHGRKRSAQCRKCFTWFSQESSLRAHERTVHQHLKPFRCAAPGCGQTFGKRFTANRHYKTVHEMQRAFQCPTCLSRFSQRGHMIQHRENVHGENRGTRPRLKTFACKAPECKIPFWSRAVAERHYEAVHSKDRPFVCPICDACFAEKDHVANHRVVVHGENRQP